MIKPPSLDGWLSWSIDGIPYALRSNKDQTYDYHVNIKNPRPLKSHYDELYENARAMRDTYTGTFDVLLSGGIDSEIIVRVFKDLGITHNTFIFKYEKEYNHRDVASAIDICECLNIPYTIIDFELEKYYEQEAYEIFKKSGCLRAARLPHLKFFDYLDGIPITGESEPYWQRTLGVDYTARSDWTFCMGESFHNTSMYVTSLGREHVVDWYEFSPNVIRSFIELPTVQDLLNDKQIGKKSTWSNRIPIYKHLWPDIKPKVKLVGYETNEFPGTYPKFITDLQKTMTEELGEGRDIWLSYQEFLNLFQ